MADLVKTDALLDELLKDCHSPEDILGQHGLLKQLTKRLVERALEGELTAHLGYEPHEKEAEGRENTRNGRSAKRLQTETGPLPIDVPRDRAGSFEPQLVKKRQRCGRSTSWGGRRGGDIDRGAFHGQRGLAGDLGSAVAGFTWTGWPESVEYA